MVPLPPTTHSDPRAPIILSRCAQGCCGWCAGVDCQCPAGWALNYRSAFATGSAAAEQPGAALATAGGNFLTPEVMEAVNALFNAGMPDLAAKFILAAATQQG
ncbi:hypothetical protein HXX76_004086 [Chlamydomonas incerta]|uniref:Uncharacterized protein n=1 Tax=Chlamydomonas incerta TaxID=51695 RepID=A0A835TAA2_CHLIN|nr:hypothetical protein HXX76_004086 [Chlamydomonas incerta]|eukprot:KAG2439967.1 hypothetical protein HXX76_004086 [Chlamydomonas incerta]